MTIAAARPVAEETAPLAKILIVDDEPQIRRFLRISLTANNYEVVEAGRGEEAINRTALDKVDLVILDLGLPDIDGQTVIAQIREWSTVPIIVLSVRAGDTEKVRALDGGAEDYLTKPFSIAELMARVRAALRKRSEGPGLQPRRADRRSRQAPRHRGRGGHQAVTQGIRHIAPAGRQPGPGSDPPAAAARGVGPRAS
jgi:two-component system KDP operon response regulator KdpE